MLNNKESKSNQSSIPSTSQAIRSCPSWWNSTGHHISHPSLPRNLSLNLESPVQNAEHVKRVGSQLQDQESSSSQSTGQSRQVMGTVEPPGQCIPAHGNGENSGYQIEVPPKHVLALGAADVFFPGTQTDYDQSVVHIPYHYTDPYFGGLVATYGSQIHAPVYGVQPARVPLPDLAVDAPIFVNAKQYRGILRRRESRAKLEAQNKLVKSRKPYLHESRHLHAMKRARGSGGRFLNTKKSEESNTPSPARDGQNATSTGLPLDVNVSRPEAGQSEKGSSTGASSVVTSCSEESSIAKQKDDTYKQVELDYPSVFSHVDGTLKDGGSLIQKGALYRVSAIR